MKITFLQSKTFFSLIVLSTLVFIAWGDMLLPTPLNLYSRNTRDNLEQLLLGVFPDVDSEAKRPSKRREVQLKNFEQQVAPSSNNY